MKPEDVLVHTPLVLTDVQRPRYFADGFLVLPDYVPERWLRQLRAATQDMLDRSRDVAQSDAVFVLEEGHSPIGTKIVFDSARIGTIHREDARSIATSDRSFFRLTG